jgi:hypothetical protein
MDKVSIEIDSRWVGYCLSLKFQDTRFRLHVL